MRLVRHASCFSQDSRQRMFTSRVIRFSPAVPHAHTLRQTSHYLCMYPPLIYTPDMTSLTAFCLCFRVIMQVQKKAKQYHRVCKVACPHVIICVLGLSRHPSRHMFAQTPCSVIPLFCQYFCSIWFHQVRISRDQSDAQPLASTFPHSLMIMLMFLSSEWQHITFLLLYFSVLNHTY